MLKAAIWSVERAVMPVVDKPAIGGNASNAYVIMKATKNKDASAKLVEFLTTDKTAVTKQLQADENFRKGYEYKTDTLGAEIQKLVTDTPASSWTPTGDGYGARTVPAAICVCANGTMSNIIETWPATRS